MVMHSCIHCAAYTELRGVFSNECVPSKNLSIYFLVPYILINISQKYMLQSPQQVCTGNTPRLAGIEVHWSTHIAACTAITNRLF